MRRYGFEPSYLRDFLAVENSLSPADIEVLDALLDAIITDPLGVHRVQSFYDPTRPSWLVRSGSFVLHYAFDEEADEVIFINLIRRA